MKALGCLALASCALTSKSAPLELRYFSPQTGLEPAAARTGPARARLRLGRLTTSAHLRYAIVHRDSAVESAPYQTLRWTETPDVYVRRSLVHELFDLRRVEQVLEGDAPALDVELVGFEEVVHGARHAGRVEVRYELHDDHRVIARGVAAVERAANGADIEHVVSAIASAMTAVTADVADRTMAELCPN